jgi:hypothetical protein
LRTPIVRSLFRNGLGTAAILFCSVSAWFLSGCGVAPYTDTTTHTLSISGTALGGQPPISNASVILFASGSTGYGSGASAIGTATTDASGNFQITGFVPCGDPQQVYIVATGGNPGLGAGTNNTAIVLVAALGNCSTISSSTHVIINEVTTIAAAYALSGFASPSTTPVPVEIGTSATNASGLTHAFLNAANIVNSSTGSARATTPAGNGIVPTNMINSLADILEPCVNSTSKTSTACTSLFTDATPPTGFGSAPANTWQAALEMAQYPGNNTAALYGLISGTASFQSTIGSNPPNDLSIGVLYSAGFAKNGTTAAAAPWGIAADSSDNLWITGVTNAGLIELSSNGTLLSPAGGWGSAALQTASITQQVAVDQQGNIWTVDNAASGGNIYRYNPGAATTTVTTPGTVALGGIAVDGSNNIWYSTKAASGTQAFNQLAYQGSNTFATTPTTFTGSNVIGSGGVSALTVDAKTGNVWGPSQGSFLANYFLSPYSAAVGATPIGSSGTAYAAAMDKSGNIWITNTITGAGAGSLFMVPHGNVTTTTPTVYSPTVTSGLGLDGSTSLMIDGNNRIFVNSYAAGTIVEFDPTVGSTGGSSGSFLLTSTGNGFAPYNSGGVNNSALVKNGDRTMAIDATGSIWTVNGTAGSIPVVQILGVAAPTVPVLAQGKYGVKP